MSTGRNRIMSEGKIMKESLINLYDETITEDEKKFLVDLFNVIDDLVKSKKKISLLAISKVLKVKPAELQDYSSEILQFEQRSILRYSYNT